MKGHVQWEFQDDFTWVGLATIGLLKACVREIVDKLQVDPMISEHTEPGGSSAGRKHKTYNGKCYQAE